jgi:catechol 2,3-dioxygenase
LITHEIAHVGSVELLTPEPDESLRFFTRVMGLTEVGSEGDSVYLRTWDDYEHHTVKLTAHGTSGIRRTALRTWSQEALERRVKAIEDAGLGVGWRDGDPGIGRRTCSATPTATSWSCTGRASGTRRRRS